MAIHSDTAEREREVVMQVNHQLLTQINVLREAQRVIELGAQQTRVDTPPEVDSHLTAPTDLHFKLNKMRSKVTPPHEDPESIQADTPTPKGNASPIRAKTEDAPAFTPLKLPIDQILYIIKHQPWVKLAKMTKHDPDPLKSRSCSFHGSRGHAILHCWALK